MIMITTLNLVAGRWRSGNNPPRWASSAWIVEIMMIVAMMVMVKMGMMSILVIRYVEVKVQTCKDSRAWRSRVHT